MSKVQDETKRELQDLFLNSTLFLSPTEYLSTWIRTLHPAIFGMVMATGIVSIAIHNYGFRDLSLGLYWFNLFLYLACWFLFLLRILLFPGEVAQDFSQSQRAPGFFTIAAANSVVIKQSLLIGGNHQWAPILWWTSFFLWCCSIYPIFVLIGINKNKPGIEQGMNGGWLVAVVATQSLTILGLLASPDLIYSRPVTAFILTSFWLFGDMLYIWIITLIFYRYFFFKFEPTDLMPPYWINMGAAAISALAGATLVDKLGGAPEMAPFVPFIKGLTLMFWATATWWIPMLLLFGFWRHFIAGVRFSYSPLYWALVFPLGMYSVCTGKLNSVLIDLPFLKYVSQVFMIIGLVAWTLNFLGMCSRIIFFFMLCSKFKWRLL